MWRSSLALLALSGMAQAETCAPITRFLQTHTPPALASGPAICNQSRILGGGRSFDCHWVFDYRADAASAVFVDFARLLEHCAEAEVTEFGAGVNHPDSYTLRQFRIGAAEVSVSLKDKAGLGQTLVGLRVAD